MDCIPFMVFNWEISLIIREKGDNFRQNISIFKFNFLQLLYENPKMFDIKNKKESQNFNVLHSYTWFLLVQADNIPLKNMHFTKDNRNN